MTKNKKGRRGKLLGEVIFWIHTVILLFVMIAGLLMPWYWVVIIVMGLRIQVILLHGCILTLLEVKEEHHRKGTAYYYLAFKRFFGIRLNKVGVYVVSAVHDLIAGAVALYATIYHVRFHL